MRLPRRPADGPTAVHACPANDPRFDRFCQPDSRIHAAFSAPNAQNPRRRSERRGLPYMTAAFLSACRRIAKRTPPGPSADVFPDPPALRASREGIARPRRSSPAVRRTDVVAVSAERVVRPRRSSPSKRTATPRKRSRTCRPRRSTPPEDGPRPRATAKT